MVILTISKYTSNWMAPKLLRVGLWARHRCFPKSSAHGNIGDDSDYSYYYNAMVALPFLQRMTSLAIYEAHQRIKMQSKTDDGKRRGSTSAETLLSTKHRLEDLSKRRMESLETILRPALLPHNNLARDLATWQSNVRFVKWLRQEVLVAKYGPYVVEALEAFPQLRSSPQLAPPRHAWITKLWTNQKMTVNPQTASTSSSLPQQHRQRVLPSSTTLVKALGMQRWTKEKQSKTSVPPSININENASLEHVLDVVTQGSGGYIRDCGPFNVICEEANIFQWWTKEYIQHLGDYLIDSKSSLQNTSSNSRKILVLEVGAGDGLLTQHLQDYYEQMMKQQHRKRGIFSQQQQQQQTPLIPKMEWFATDDQSWRIEAKAPVGRLSVQQALERYAGSQRLKDEENGEKPRVVVLCSWMPMGQDWSKLFREYSVDEYILIGEADTVSCGDLKDTWGVGLTVNADDTSGQETMPLFEQEGYQRWNFDSLSKYQFSRFDHAQSKTGSTVVFRRSNCGA